MKRIPTLFLLLAISLFVIISCKKEVAKTTTPSNINNDSIYIDKWYVIDSTNSFEDTSFIYDFSYDNLKRAASIDLTTINPQTFLMEHYGTNQYYYTTTDTLPFKSYKILNDFFTIPVATDTTTSFYFYDLSGRKIKDSILRTTWDGYDYISRVILTDYTYLPGKVLSQSVANSTTYHASGGMDNLLYHSYDTTTIDVDGNDTDDMMNFNGYLVKSTGTYNTQPNVFSKLTIKGNLDFPNFYQHFYYFPTNTKNNPTQLHQITNYGEPNAASYNFNYIYTYQPNGLVSKFVFLDESVVQPGKYKKYAFHYTAL